TPPKSIVELPELKIYYQEFGTEKGDICLVAETDNKIVGAVWTRIVNDFAHIDDNTPSLAIAVAKESRGKEIGTRLLNEMLTVLKDAGFLSVSLSVQKENYAVKMYEKAGFEVVKDNGEEFVMRKNL
ncbi:TPA: GNAT family N-acetyltransferase, partial [Candidatus Scatousia excrementigallinarum]|nr:GNAT family N-acetyltransferase [Candidatus Scatousia excrementigallinarum]